MDASLSRKSAYTISLILLVLSASLQILYWQGRVDVLPAENLHRLPLTINGWEGREIAVSERDKALLGTSNVILRQYRKGRSAVNLYILECASNRASFHPPEYCYVGGRTEMVEQGRRTVRWDGTAVTAHRFIFLGPHGRSLVYYWYTFGGRFLASYYRQQLYIVSSAILGRPQPALLIRLSVEGSFETEMGDVVIATFAREVMGTIEEYLLRGQEEEKIISDQWAVGSDQ